MLQHFQEAVDDNTLLELKQSFERSMEASKDDESYGIMQGQKEWEPTEIIEEDEEIVERIDNGDILDVEEQQFVMFDDNDSEIA